MNQKPLHIPKSKSIKGLKVFCYECKTTIGDLCKQTGKSVHTCKFGHRHAFKVVAHVPGGSESRKTKTLDTRNLQEARREALEFLEEIKEGNAGVRTMPVASPVIERQEPPHGKSETIMELMSTYIGYLYNDPEIVPAHKVKVRSKRHLEQSEQACKLFVQSLRAQGYPVGTLTPGDITEMMIGKFHLFLLEEKKCGNSAYNRTITILTSFFNYLKREGHTTRNPFEAIAPRPVSENIETIEQDEFIQLLALAEKPELGIRTLSNGIRKNLYKPWLKDGFALSLYSGRRREEVARMKWSDIVLESDGTPLCISVPDLKVNRQKGNTKENLKHNYVPITEEVWSVLHAMGAQTKIGSDAYILAGEEQITRETVCKLLSRGFSHYYEQLGTGKELSFGCLRRTYFSHLSGAIGLENAQTISGHSSTAIMKKHYVSKQVLSKAAKHFSVWKKGEGAADNSLPVQQHKTKEKDSPFER